MPPIPYPAIYVTYPTGARPVSLCFGQATYKNAPTQTDRHTAAVMTVHFLPLEGGPTPRTDCLPTADLAGNDVVIAAVQMDRAAFHPDGSDCGHCSIDRRPGTTMRSDGRFTNDLPRLGFCRLANRNVFQLAALSAPPLYRPARLVRRGGRGDRRGPHLCRTAQPPHVSGVRPDPFESWAQDRCPSGGNPLFLSAARCTRRRVTGIVLSGDNSDGAAGLRTIKQAGSRALVQQPAEAEAPAMPLSAIAADTPEALTVEQIAERLRAL